MNVNTLHHKGKTKPPRLRRSLLAIDMYPYYFLTERYLYGIFGFFQKENAIELEQVVRNHLGAKFYLLYIFCFLIFNTIIEMRTIVKMLGTSFLNRLEFQISYIYF